MLLGVEEAGLHSITDLNSKLTTILSVFCLGGVEQNNKSLPPWNVESSETISGPSRHKVTSRAVGVLHSPVNMLQED